MNRYFIAAPLANGRKSRKHRQLFKKIQQRYDGVIISEEELESIPDEIEKMYRREFTNAKKTDLLVDDDELDNIMVDAPYITISFKFAGDPYEYHISAFLIKEDRTKEGGEE